jgi:hypothetical protein
LVSEVLTGLNERGRKLQIGVRSTHWTEKKRNYTTKWRQNHLVNTYIKGNTSENHTQYGVRNGQWMHIKRVRTLQTVNRALIIEKTKRAKRAH